MNKTEEKYEKICTTWEEMNLQNVCAREAAAKLGVSPITLVIALKTRRPGGAETHDSVIQTGILEQLLSELDQVT